MTVTCEMQDERDGDGIVRGRIMTNENSQIRFGPVPIIIDVEASGFGQGSYPVEIGLVLPDGTPHCFLVMPARGWRDWDPEAEKIHGISRSLVESHGRPVEEIAWRLNGLLYGHTVYSDAWSFDMSWLGKLFDKVNMPQKFEVAALRDILSEEQQRLWDDTRRLVEKELNLRRHRASGDARILQETYRRTLTRAA
jgi:hypothetical protein